MITWVLSKFRELWILKIFPKIIVSFSKFQNFKKVSSWLSTPFFISQTDFPESWEHTSMRRGLKTSLLLVSNVWHANSIHALHKSSNTCFITDLITCIRKQHTRVPFNPFPDFRSAFPEFQSPNNVLKLSSLRFYSPRERNSRVVGRISSSRYQSRDGLGHLVASMITRE